MNHVRSVNTGESAMTRIAARPLTKGAEPLVAERRFFQVHRSELSAQYRGLFLLIKGDRLIGAYATARIAYHEGSRRFGWEPFLVQMA